jgi:tetratricopeptide (TPR) repeat protein
VPEQEECFKKILCYAPDVWTYVLMAVSATSPSVYQTRNVVSRHWADTVKKYGYREHVLFSGGAVLSEQIDESTLRTQLRSILDVPAGASRRQLRRARDREVQLCRDDMLASDPKLNALAKKRLAELDRAFEYLTEPKKFRDFHELVNDKITLGTLEPGSLAASIARREGFDNKSNAGETAEVLEVSSEGAHTSLAEEREVLKELRRKRLEKAPKVGHKRLKALENLIKDTNTQIEQGANTAAKAKASELIARGYTNSDDFFETVYTAALEATQATRDRAIKTIEEKDLPVDEKLLDEWEAAVLDKSEEAAEREYNLLEGTMASQKSSTPGGPKLFFKIAVTLVTIAAALVVYCNINVAVTTNRPDALGQQIQDAGGGAVGVGDLYSVLKQLPSQLSANPAIATAEGMISNAGTAGPAGSAMSMAIDGAVDYTAGCSALTKGDFNVAIGNFNNSIAKNKNIFQYPYNRAMGWLALGHYQAAITDFDAAISLRTDLMQARYNKGVIFLLGGADYASRANSTANAKDKAAMKRQAVINLRAAIAEFSSVSSKMPDLAQPFYNRALARYRLGDLRGAVSDFEAALKRDAKLSAAKFNLEIAKAAQAAPDKKPVLPAGTTPSAPVGPQGPPAPGLF